MELLRCECSTFEAASINPRVLEVKPPLYPPFAAGDRIQTPQIIARHFEQQRRRMDGFPDQQVPRGDSRVSDSRMKRVEGNQSTTFRSRHHLSCTLFLVTAVVDAVFSLCLLLSLV